MFPTFRHRILFWFLLFIGSNIIIIAMAGRYLASRDNIARQTEKIRTAYILLLKSVNAQHNFFSFDTRNPDFFKSQKSRNLKDFDSLHRALLLLIRDESEIRRASIPVSVSKSIDRVDSLFMLEVKLASLRGYKDYSLEGSMRRHAHWLEDKSGLKPEEILSLRRNEKDYIIRNEHVYVERLNALCEQLAVQVGRSQVSNKDSVLHHIAAYRASFNRLVELDNLSGLKDNTGLKRILDKNTEDLEERFEQIVAEAKLREQRLYKELAIYYAGIVVLLMGLGFAASLIIARRITRPLTDLTEYITRFVDSNFTIEDGTPSIRSRDEVGKLTRNFSMLRDEVITRLRFFKQKVDERTAELAGANEKLTRINLANSRFVPREFLDFLNRPSIEAVKLGDQSAREMTVMFADIRSFTRISETLTPQENFDFLNSYLRHIVPIIKKHGGFIDKFIGDSIMALFPRDSQDAMRAALEIVSAVNEFNLLRNGEPIRIGAGIHKGHLILGTIGHDHRLETTVISDAVNIASRVEGLTRHYDCSIIVTRECIGQVSNRTEFPLRFLDTVRMKGKRKEIEVFELLPAEELGKLAYQEQFDTAIHLFRMGKLSEALGVFQTLRELNPADGAVGRYAIRCNEFIKNGIPLGWDGTEVMSLK